MTSTVALLYTVAPSTACIPVMSPVCICRSPKAFNFLPDVLKVLDPSSAIEAVMAQIRKTVCDIVRPVELLPTFCAVSVFAYWALDATTAAADGCRPRPSQHAQLTLLLEIPLAYAPPTCSLCLAKI